MVYVQPGSSEIFTVVTCSKLGAKTGTPPFSVLNKDGFSDRIINSSVNVALDQ